MTPNTELPPRAEWLPFDDVLELLQPFPTFISERRLRSWVENGLFPTPARFVSRRSPAYFRIDDLSAWARENFFTVPKTVAHFERAMLRRAEAVVRRETKAALSAAEKAAKAKKVRDARKAVKAALGVSVSP